MAGKRSSPPLFEVLSRQGGAPDLHAPSEPSARKVHPAVLKDPAEPPPPGRISVPITAVYAFASAALLLAVVTWVVAYKVGFGRGEQETLREFGLIDPGPAGGLARGPDPLATNPPSFDNEPTVRPRPEPRRERPTEPDNTRSSEPEETRSQARPTPTPADPEGPIATAAFIGPEGALSEDPREGGLNYLKLASNVPRPEATELVPYLSERGLPALAVMTRPGSVDSGGGATNDSDRFDLYAIDLAVPGARFSAMRSQRERLQEQAARLGSQWRRERQGTVDLARTNWELYRPD
ncbi:MAG: hypothetical protein JJU33_13315 [Phycisphaerales bacterium]|nr:hypothetical protein [Phycisphaerales bacterium]